MIPDPRDILLAPVVSEKSYGLLEERQYTFIVRPDANKTQIKIAVEKVFGVKVLSVNTLNRPGKRKRTRTGYGKRKDTKRAIVTLSPGEPDDRRLRRPGELRGTKHMGIRKYKPTTPGRRGVERRRLRRDHPRPRRRSRWSARCTARAAATSHGRVTTRHQGGGHKRAYRLIDFRRNDKDGVPAKVAHIEYDPNRTAPDRAAALRRRREALHHRAGPAASRATRWRPARRPTSSPATTCRCATSRSAPWCTRSSSAPAAAPRSPARPARSVQLVAKDGPYAQLRMPSGEIRNVDVRCRATVGEVGNAEQSNINWGKAGRMRWKGKRPTVRGVAMNPVDHPHGGGEGKTSGGRHPVNPAGKPEGRTRRTKPSDKLIVRRRRTGKKR